MSGAVVLGPRALNRALLARQGLLERSGAGPAQMLEQLVGLQAQVPENPYVALWSRLRDFEALSLSTLIAGRGAVRAQLMRSTIHLVTARDMLAIAPLTLPILVRTFKSPWSAKLAGVPVDDVVSAGLELLQQAPRTRAELADLLGPRWRQADAAALAYAVTFHLSLVQVPPRGLWGGRGEATWAPAESWLDAPLHESPSVDALVLRYLAAFGPATVADVRTWSGLTNVLLSHADRSRVLAGVGPGLPLPQGGRAFGALLADGVFRAFWQIVEDPSGATLTIDRFTRLPGEGEAVVSAIAEEATGLLTFLSPDAREHRVHFKPQP